MTIGSGIEEIGSWIFAFCPKLKNVYCHAEQVPYTFDNTFEDAHINNCTLHVPAASVNAYKVAPWNEFKEVVKLSGK